MMIGATTIHMEARAVYTVGHSTHPLDQFTAMLHAHGVKAIADVRQYPRSRRFPHFNAESLAVVLPESDIAYVPMKSLGGRRRASKDSINTGWKNEAFRGYADFMQTEEFAHALDDLMVAAIEKPTAIMCAEAVPWRCHRSLIADALLVRNWRVLDILSPASIKPHELTKFARVKGTEITYPPADSGLFESAD